MNYYHYILSFGSNLGDKKNNILLSIVNLLEFSEVEIISKIIETEALKDNNYDTSNHDTYLNAVGYFVSKMEPKIFYSNIVKIEDKIGHSRLGKWLPRQIDIDILYVKIGKKKQKFEELINYNYKKNNGLTIPHYAIQDRFFLIDLINKNLNIKT